MRKRTLAKSSTAREKNAPTRSKKVAGTTAVSPSPADEGALRGKTRLTMYLDVNVVEYFRTRAGGRGYQTLINETLRRAIEQENLENVLRRVIREEARPRPAAKSKS
jgi:uncharacterized protein (DUF4415 family)